MRTLVAGIALGSLLLHAPCVGAAQDAIIRVGSKSFTESYILAEIAAQVIEQTGEAKVERRLGLGGTGLAYRAIASDAIDLYPEYTGTLARIILKDPALRTPEAIRARLRPLGLTTSEPLGFNNTYALAVRVETAERLDLRTIGDLARHPELRAPAASDTPGRPGFLPGLLGGAPRSPGHG
jgi:osmoprotectant transport system permease protein